MKPFKDQLAEIEHQRWADWQRWCHVVLRENCPSPELEKVLERWDRQIATPYEELTDLEKASDMEQVDRYWWLIQLDRNQTKLNTLARLKNDWMQHVMNTRDIKRVMTLMEFLEDQIDKAGKP